MAARIVPDGVTGSRPTARSRTCPRGTRKADSRAATAITRPTTNTPPIACASTGRIWPSTASPSVARVIGFTARSG